MKKIICLLGVHKYEVFDGIMVCKHCSKTKKIVEHVHVDEDDDCGDIVAEYLAADLLVGISDDDDDCDCGD